MLVSEVIQAIQSLYSRGVQSQDSRLRSRHIWNKLLRVRTTLIENRINKNQPVSQWVYQTLPCVELVPAAVYECPCIPPSGCILLRSKYPIPRPITTLKGDAVQSISSLDGSLIIDSTTFAANKYADGNKFTAKKPQRLLYNDYLFVTMLKQLKVVQITQICEDPEEAWKFPSYCDEDCTECCMSPLDRFFPLDGKTTDDLIQLTANELISIFVQMKEDKFNNSSDDTANSNMVHNPNQAQ